MAILMKGHYFQVLSPHCNNLTEYHPTPTPTSRQEDPHLLSFGKFSNPTIVGLEKGQKHSPLPQPMLIFKRIKFLALNIF